MEASGSTTVALSFWSRITPHMVRSEQVFIDSSRLLPQSHTRNTAWMWKKSCETRGHPGTRMGAYFHQVVFRLFHTTSITRPRGQTGPRPRHPCSRPTRALTSSTRAPIWTCNCQFLDSQPSLSHSIVTNLRACRDHQLPLPPLPFTLPVL